MEFTLVYVGRHKILIILMCRFLLPGCRLSEARYLQWSFLELIGGLLSSNTDPLPYQICSRYLGKALGQPFQSYSDPCFHPFPHGHKGRCCREGQMEGVLGATGCWTWLIAGAGLSGRVPKSDISYGKLIPWPQETGL
jgi:hypothetical protein